DGRRAPDPFPRPKSLPRDSEVDDDVADVSPATGAGGEPTIGTAQIGAVRAHEGAVVCGGSRNDIEGAAERRQQLAVLPRAVREYEIREPTKGERGQQPREHPLSAN